MEIDEHSKSINAVIIVWTWRNFILPGSKPAYEVRSCHLVTLYIQFI
jgi:hypothetical protein